MKILYRQNVTTSDRLTILSHNIKNCYLKKLVYNNDYKITTGNLTTKYLFDMLAKYGYVNA